MKDRKELKNRDQSEVVIVVYYWFLSRSFRSFNFPPPDLSDLSPTCPTSLRPVRPLSDLPDLSPTSFFCVCSLSFSCLLPTYPILFLLMFCFVLVSYLVLSFWCPALSHLLLSRLVSPCSVMSLTCIPLFVFAGSLLSCLPIFGVVV